MKKLFSEIKEDKMIYGYYIDAFFIFISILYLSFSYNQLPPYVPVFNQLPWGEQRLGSQASLFFPIAAAIIILIVNFFTSAYLYKKIPLIARMLTAVSLLTGILTFIFILKTITVLT